MADPKPQRLRQEINLKNRNAFRYVGARFSYLRIIAFGVRYSVKNPSASQKSVNVSLFSRQKGNTNVAERDLYLLSRGISPLRSGFTLTSVETTFVPRRADEGVRPYKSVETTLKPRVSGHNKAPLCKGGSHRRWVGDCKVAIRIVVWIEQSYRFSSHFVRARNTPGS